MKAITIEEYKNLKNEYCRLLDYFHIDKLLRFDAELMGDLADLMIERKQFERKYSHNSLIYILGYFVSIIRAWVYGMLHSHRDECSKVRNILFQFPTRYNRFQRIACDIEDCVVLYVPIFGWSILSRHIAEHRMNKTRVVVVWPSVVVVLKAIIFGVKNFIQLLRIGASQINKDKHDDFYKCLLLFILQYEAFLLSIEQGGLSLVRDSENVIFDYEKHEASLAIKYLKKKYSLEFRSIGINHGSFTGFNLCYVNTYSDLTLCTCEREVNLYRNYSTQTNVIPVGVPLQSFTDIEIEANSLSFEEGILVLGTSVAGIWERIQYDLIEYMNKSHLPYMYRARPDSAKNDIQALAGVLPKERITCDTTLKEDCSRFKTIVSFSLDALSVAIRLQKRVAIYLPSDVLAEFSPIGSCTNQIIVTDKLTEILDFVMCDSVSEYTEDTKTWVYHNIGELEYWRVSRNIINAIKEQE